MDPKQEKQKGETKEEKQEEESLQPEQKEEEGLQPETTVQPASSPSSPSTVPALSEFYLLWSSPGSDSDDGIEYWEPFPPAGDPYWLQYGWL